MARAKFLVYAALSGVLAGLAAHATAPASQTTTSGNAAAGSTLLELPPAPNVPAPSAAPSAPPPAAAPVLASPPTPAPAPAISPAAPAAVATTPVPVPAAAAVTSAVIPAQQSAAPVPSAPAHPAAAPARTKAADDVISKNPDLLLEPMHLGITSLMFNKGDMDVIIQALEVYDNSVRAQKTENTDNKDSLSSLLDSLKSQTTTTTSMEAPLPLPNLYLGSIVYYSPSHWSVWINGRKLVNRNNQQSNEFYIDRISRTEVELIWRPSSLLDTPEIWRQKTDNGEHPLPKVIVDAQNGKIILQMHTNQTFLPRSLTIREGLIRPSGTRAAPVTPIATSTLPALSAPAPVPVSVPAPAPAAASAPAQAAAPTLQSAGTPSSKAISGSVIPHN